MKAFFSLRSQRGSALAVVIIVIAGSSIILGSLLNFAAVEKENNHRQYMWMHARNLAEAIVDVGMGQLRNRFETRASLPADSMLPSRNPIYMPDAFFSFYEDDMQMTDGEIMKYMLPEPSNYNKRAEWGTYDSELIGGVIPDGEAVYINPNDPANADDELAGSTVRTVSVPILAKAMVEDHRGNQAKAFASAALLVRDAPLFNHAIFFNMDLEIHPGPNMNIIGKVHSNGDLYYSAGNTIWFHQLVSSSEEIHFGRKPGSGKGWNDNTVWFNSGWDDDGNPEFVSNKFGDERLGDSMDNFRERSANAFNYFVQSSAHGMGSHNAVGIEDYVADDPETSEVDDDLNYAYQMIQPILPEKPDTSTEEGEVDYELEQQKFAYKAGLTIVIDPDTNEVSEVYSYKREGAEGKNIAYQSDGTPDRIELTLPQIDGEEIVTVKPDLIYDRRNFQSMNIVEIDMFKLKKAIESVDVANMDDADESLQDEARDIINDWGADPSDWWNGVVYVALPYADPDEERKDGVKPAIEDYAVKLINGQQLPNPSFAQGVDIYGTTIATNAPVYVEGNYNANGVRESDAETSPDAPYADLYRPNTKYEEAAAAIIGDAVNFLSTDWEDDSSWEGLSNRRIGNNPTEVSAAIISGIVPTGKGGNTQYSGGVENFPRFLEDWGNNRSRHPFVYRGSMVALYESEVQDERWGHGNVYTPPERAWGFNTMYALGKYPPGMPYLRHYKRVNFRWIDEDEFEATKDKMKEVMTEMASGTGST